MLGRIKPTLKKPKFRMLTNLVTSVIMLFTVIFIIANFS